MMIERKGKRISMMKKEEIMLVTQRRKAIKRIIQLMRKWKVQKKVMR